MNQPNYIPVLTSKGHPLAPCHPKRARSLVRASNAQFLHRDGIRWVVLTNTNVPKVKAASKLQLRIDPGSKHTGIAITRDDPDGSRDVLMALVVNHRGRNIKNSMVKRRAHRSNQLIEQWLKRRPKKLAEIEALLGMTLADATHMNVILPTLLQALRNHGWTVVQHSTASTAATRRLCSVEKSHHGDAAMTGCHAKPRAPTPDGAEATMPHSQKKYPFTFRKRVTVQQPPSPSARPTQHQTEIVVAFNGTERQAMNTARRLYGDHSASTAVRMALDCQQLHPAVLEREGLTMLARLHSEETGQEWQPRPTNEVPLHVFDALLRIAERHCENGERRCRVTPDDARQRHVPFQLALTRPSTTT